MNLRGFKDQSRLYSTASYEFINPASRARLTQADFVQVMAMCSLEGIHTNSVYSIAAV
jgi:hypothetical protein